MFKKLKGRTIICLLMMAGALWLTKLKFDKLGVLKHGKDVTVRIVDIPVPCGEGSRINKPHFTFDCLGKTYRKDFNGQHCTEIKSGDAMALVTDTELSVFLFSDEDIEIERDIAAGIGLAVMFLVFAVIGQRQKDKSLMPRQKHYKKEKKSRQPGIGRYGNKIE